MPLRFYGNLRGDIVLYLKCFARKRIDKEDEDSAPLDLDWHRSRAAKDTVVNNFPILRVVYDPCPLSRY
jgi:hypothetical protein